MSLYSFYSDKCFLDPADRTINLEQLDIPAGYLDREMIEHFVEPLELVDPRTQRLEIEYRQSTYQPLNDTVLIEDILHNIIPAGEARVAQYPTNTVTVAQYTELDYTIFEGETLPGGLVRIANTPTNITFDATVLAAEEVTAINALTDTEIEFIFNTIEYLFYGTIPADTLEQINTTLTNDTRFTNYIPTTVRLSQLHVAVAIFGGLDIHRFAPQWVEFGYNKDGTPLTFTVWIDRNAFVIGYPLYTVQDITPPLDLATLIDPSGLTDPLEAAALSREQVTDSLVPTILVDDQLGMSFSTRYIWNNTTHYLSFTILYRGRALSPLEARLAIKDYLLNSGVGTEALWSIKFPDIFLRSTFFLIPEYDHTYNRPIGTMYPAVTSLKSLVDKLQYFSTIIDSSTPDNMEIMACAYENFVVGIVGITTNNDDTFFEVHPTYTDVSSTDIGFAEMEEHTKQMSLIVNNIIAIGDGEVNGAAYAVINLFGADWVMAVHEGVAYMVMDKTSYLTLLSGMP